MKHFFLVALFVLFSYRCFAQPDNRPKPSYGNSKVNSMWGIVATYNITSAIELVPLGLEASYNDIGAGFVFNRRNVKNESSSNEFIMSFHFSSASTIPNGESLKFTFPMDIRWFRGWSGFKFYFGLGVQYNCLIITQNDNTTEWSPDIDANQFSVNFQGGILFFNDDSPFHILIGGKWHQPIYGNALGTYLNNNGKIDFSSDKKTLIAYTSLSFKIGETILMLEYNLPLNGKKQQPTPPANQEVPSFFERQSQTFALTLFF